MIDIGANLQHQSFHDDLPEVLTRARNAGIDRIIVTGTSIEASRHALELARHYPDMLLATAGIHPHDASDFSPESLSALRDLAASPQVVAMGETGLDFHRDYSPRQAQEKAFAAQIDLAAELGKPLFLHQRDAHDRFMRILEPRLPDLGKVVVHCFTGTREELEVYLAHDLYIGITGWVCDERRGLHLHDLLMMIPENRLMVETDSPYLLPRTMTPRPATRRNEPANLRWVVKTLAEQLEKTDQQVRASSAATAAEFFGISTQASKSVQDAG